MHAWAGIGSSPAGRISGPKPAVSCEAMRRLLGTDMALSVPNAAKVPLFGAYIICVGRLGIDHFSRLDRLPHFAQQFGRRVHEICRRVVFFGVILLEFV